MSWNTGLARIGAVFYVLWGLVHYNAAYGVYQLAQSTPLTIEHGRLEQSVKPDLRKQLGAAGGQLRDLLQFCTAKGRCVVCHQPGTALLTSQ